MSQRCILHRRFVSSHLVANLAIDNVLRRNKDTASPLCAKNLHAVFCFLFFFWSSRIQLRPSCYMTDVQQVQNPLVSWVFCDFSDSFMITHPCLILAIDSPHLSREHVPSNIQDKSAFFHYKGRRTCVGAWCFLDTNTVSVYSKL